MSEAILQSEERLGPGTAADADQPDSSATLPLFEALRHLDQLLGMAVARAHAVLGADPFRGLHIGPEDVQRWLARAPGEAGGVAAEPEATAAAASAVSAALEDPTVHWLAEIYALTPFQMAVLIIALAPELDLKYERLFAYLQDDVGKKRPTVDLILQLLCPTLRARSAARAEFSSGATLTANRLIAVRRGADAPLLTSSVQLDEQITALLLGDDHLDSRLRGFCRMRRPDTRLDDLAIPDDWRKALSALVPQAYDARPFRLYLQGPAGCGKDRLAEAIAASVGAPLITADLAFPGHLAPDLGESLDVLFREAWFKDAVLHLRHVDRLRDEDGAAFSSLLRALVADSRVTLLSGQASWTGSELEPTGVVPLVFDFSDPVLKRGMWSEALQQADIALSDEGVGLLAERFRLSPAQTSEAVAVAVNRCRWDAASADRDTDNVRPDVQNLILSARDQCGYELATLAQRIKPRRCWGDLVLPEDPLTQLREICLRVRCHRQVLNEWGFAQRITLGKGITALFRGPSGTGKTLAAEIIANELGLYLYKIDLSTVVSKYIGETEKNLSRVFLAAQDANAVLFFDEADAIFGKRSEVHDSHDRYANLEISYLLQKMEEFEGLAILATNLHSNMDDAFTRRLAFTVHFPFPSETERLKIWRVVWPEQTPLAAEADFATLARDFKLSGGNIKNVALSAAYGAAATQSERITIDHIRHALRREYQKFGKILKHQDLARIDFAAEGVQA
jgi:AAA+ superfamily predicted ATPase